MSTAQSSQNVSLAEYMAYAWTGNDEYRGLNSVISAIAEGAREVNKKVQAAALADILGTTGEINVQGEIVQFLDTAASDIFVDLLNRSGSVAMVGSEEIPDPVIVGQGENHRYIVLTDPLDGSSNIDVAVSIGSIFGIWKREPEEVVMNESMLRPGSEQIAAAYVVYGSSTIMVVATQGSVQGFTLDTSTGAFMLTHQDIKIPKNCPYYSVNEGNYKGWNKGTQKAVTKLRDSLSLRYVGSLVADFHRNLLKGGIFLYPGDKKSPEGKLRHVAPSPS